MVLGGVCHGQSGLIEFFKAIRIVRDCGAQNYGYLVLGDSLGSVWGVDEYFRTPRTTFERGS